jgi:Cytidylate kinase-like family
VTVIAISASYGAAGGLIAPALAERLDVPFVDRAVPIGAPNQAATAGPELGATSGESGATSGESGATSGEPGVTFDEQTNLSRLERVLASFLGSDVGAGAPLPPEVLSAEGFRRGTEEVLLRQAATGLGVILGRAAVVVLRDDPNTLRVRLDGPPERRVRNAARLSGLDEAAAKRNMRRVDNAHRAYFKQFYGADLHDPTLYHMVLDSTSFSVQACVDLIARAVAEFDGL